VLFYLKGKSAEEIATALGRPRGTVLSELAAPAKSCAFGSRAAIWVFRSEFSRAYWSARPRPTLRSPTGCSTWECKRYRPVGRASPRRPDCLPSKS
jgi:hypothetical protein